ncbi:MAG: precorrin-6A synthase (deacetylating) [Paracoccus sp. (in: a-proteobacteria)]|uniref:precorrin-6A synthase (deacetylating) n=1 Tax=Paracoccus sp. TaxID=267 RepID=UPI0026E0C2CF|nr:precorrin-6A synthase (deacetylating) [Paracoccus sp. (in: a-proteobacteria)]MDO5612463.1 precorrin-6A synthase (deacetylating) [Paracoccus sp. (in: a-proteobacteria)]
MIELALIGIGMGTPDHLTGAAIAAINGADLILIPRKADKRGDLADLRHQVLAAVQTAPVPVAEFDMPERDARADYLGAVDDWHDQIAACWLAALRAHLPQGGRAALLVWGDPSLYDSTLRIAARLDDLRVSVVPGITSLQLLTAAHCVPLNGLAGAVTITTGRRLRDHGWPEGAGSVAVMLDAGGAFSALDPAGIQIWWGAYVGMAQESLIAGPLAEVGPQIIATRADLRARHGWIMDIYLMRRGPG